MKPRYRSLNAQLQTIFGERVHKIPLDAGFDCPNKNGTISTQGCIFCDPYGSGHIPHHGLSIEQQLAHFKLHRKEQMFLAYFQSHCNTHVPVETQRLLFDTCLEDRQICGLVIGSRPDSLSDPVLDLLEAYARKTFLCVELGLQSVHEKSLKWLRRNHSYAQFESAHARLKARGIRTVVHLIIGIPGEGNSELRQTIERMNGLAPWGVKFHLLHVLRETDLYDLYQSGHLQLMTRRDYIDTVLDLIERLHPAIGIHRLSADRDPSLFVAPEWAQQKTTLVNEIHTRLARENRWQGRELGFPSTAYQL